MGGEPNIRVSIIVIGFINVAFTLPRRIFLNDYVELHLFLTKQY